MDHLLIHCSVAFKLWSCIFRMFGVKWVSPEKFLIYHVGSNVKDQIHIYV